MLGGVIPPGSGAVPISAGRRRRRRRAHPTKGLARCPDQICVYRSEGAGETQRTLLYVSEYEAPHKLTAPYLRAGLHP
ncbi:hypothetical protein JX266_014592, partial [Neoarthrinium moseri]